MHLSKITNLNTSYKDMSYRTFAWKLLNDELPTFNNLHKRNPDSYTSEVCPNCQLDIENNIHIFICRKQNTDNSLEEIVQYFNTIIIHEVANSCQDKSKMKQFKENLKQFTNGFTLTDQRLMEYDFISFLDIIVGLIPNSLSSLISSVIHSKTEKEALIIRVIHKFKDQLYSIWKQRCEQILVWEKEHNITKKDKKKGSTNKSKVKSAVL